MWRALTSLIWTSLLVLATGTPTPTAYEASVRSYRENKLDSANWYIDQAIGRYQAAGMADSLVLSQVQKALVIWDLQSLDDALRLMDTTLQWVDRLPARHPARVAAYSRIGQLYMYRFEFPQATAFFRKAEQAAGPEPDPHTVVLHNHIAVMHNMQENYPLAKQHADRAYAMNLQLEGKDGPTMSMLLQTRFFISRYSEDFDQALLDGEEYQRVTRLHYPPDHPRIGTMHNSLAVIHETLRQYEQAMHHRRLAVDIQTRAYAQSGDSFSLASAYQNIGYLYGYLHEPFLAQEYLEKGSQLLARTYGEDGFGMVKPLADIAVHKHRVGKHAEADALFARAWDLQAQHAPDDLPGFAYIEGFRAEAYLDRQEFAQAAALLQTVMGRYAQAGIANSENALLARFSLAQALAGLGRFDEALAMQPLVMDGIRRLYPRGNDAIAFKWHGFSEVHLQNGDLSQAYALSDSVFCELLMLPQLPADFTGWFSSLPFSYHAMRYVGQRAEILFRMHEQSGDREALETLLSLVEAYTAFVTNHLHAFRSQAALVDLADANKRIYALAIEASWALSGEGQNPAYNAMAFSYAEQGKALLMRLTTNSMLLDQAQTGTASADLQRDQAFRQRISALNAQYLNSNRNDSLLAQLSAGMEDYRLFQDSLKMAGNPLLATRYRMDIPTPAEISDELLAKGETLLEYAVTDRSVFAFVLTGDALHVHRADKSVLKDVALLREFHGLAAADFLAPAHRLYKELVQPVEHYFEGKRLLIVPDADLYYLNFEVLATSDSEHRFAKMPFLIHQYEISYLLSATSAVQFQQAMGSRKREGKAMLLTPVFTDEMKENYRNSLPDQEARSQDDYFYLFRQPFALQAARRAGNWVPHDLFAEQQAEERLFKQAASGYRILHLGTHAEVNNHSPLHSRLYFAKAMFGDTANTDDGYLHAYEIYSLQLRAEMAVLTACETGAGTWRNGEGVVSLAHGFMHAGCPSVIMTLWKVDEQASNDIITKFYEYLSKGHGKSRALRKAKLDLLTNGNERLAHPYYWAGLSLIGDPTPVYSSRYLWVWSLALLGLAGIGCFFIRRRRTR